MPKKPKKYTKAASKYRVAPSKTEVGTAPKAAAEKSAGQAATSATVQGKAIGRSIAASRAAAASMADQEYQYRNFSKEIARIAIISGIFIVILIIASFILKLAA
jgi:hypothetical protein